MKRAVRSGFALLLALQTACSTAPPPTLARESHAALGRVAVLAGIQAPDLSFKGFLHGKGEGASAAGGGVFLTCASTLFQGGCTGAICGPVAVLWLGFCGAAGMVGAIAGAAAAPSAATVASAANAMAAAFTSDMIQRSLRDQLRAAVATADVELVRVDESLEASAVASGDFRALAGTADTVLVVGLTEAGTTATQGGSLSLQATANARLLRTGDNIELLNANYRFYGGSHSLEDWTENQGRRLLDGLQGIYARLGTHIRDSVFLLYPFPDRVPHHAGALALACGLAPIDPRSRGQVTTGDKLIGERFEWTTVASRRPRLRWEAFPRAGDLEKAPGDMRRVGNVRYDLVIARERDLAPGEIVYEREGLPEPEHRLENALASGAHYFWSVRARFELDGRERLTEWSTTGCGAEQGLVAPSPWAYRFRTP